MTQVKLSEKARRVYQAMCDLQEEHVRLGATLQAIAKRAGLNNRGSVAYHLPALIEAGLVRDAGTKSHKYVAVVPVEDKDE